MIIGTRHKEIHLGEGTFHCIKCGDEMRYAHKRFARFVVLCFVPVYAAENLDEFIVCSGCQTRFGIEALSHDPQAGIDRTLDFVREELRCGTPLEMAYRKMINSGVERKAAERVMSATAKDCTAECRRCRFHYIDGMRMCYRCGGSLFKQSA